MSRKKSFFGAALGTMLEFYDHSLFMVFFPIISPLFFPAENPLDSFIKGYFLLLVASIARPLGGLYFGYFGDTLGRRKALLLSITGVAASTFAIGLLPSVNSIGILATAAILVCKAIQIFCFGGEFNSAGIYVVEHAPENKVGLWSGLLTATTLLGALFAAIFGYFITLPDMPGWLWRTAFLLGGGLGFISMGYRKSMRESPVFEKNRTKVYSIKELFQGYPVQLITTFFIGGFAATPFVTLLSVINPLMVALGKISLHEMMVLQAFFSLIAMVAAVISGLYADHVTPVRLMKLAGILLVCLSYPLLAFVQYLQTVGSLLIAGIFLLAVNQMLLGPANAYLKNLFPPTLRCRGTGFAYCLGTTVIGGLTPVIETILYKHSVSFTAISIWPMGIGLITYLFIRHQGNQSVQEIQTEQHYDAISSG